MEIADADRLMFLLAVATPALALLARGVLGHAAQHAGEPLTLVARRNIWILATAGPASLGLWWVFNRWLDTIGHRSVAGYILAALTFIAAGFATGFFSRLRAARARPPKPPPLD